MDAKFSYVFDLINAWSERDQRKFFNQFAAALGIRTHARTAGRAGYTTGGGGGDYESLPAEEAPKIVNNSNYERNIDIITGIINKAKAEQVFDVKGMSEQMKTLAEILTPNQISKLNFDGLRKMLRYVTQARCATNHIAYILRAYDNLINDRDYKRKWQIEQKLARGEIDTKTAEWWMRQKVRVVE